jgi:catechol 2,3-dioxygenase-like lactoylglutathione lyase family enzyme
MDNGYDRAAEDLGNVVALEHVNVRIPDQRLGTIFYVTGLGLTRDPFLMTGVDNMWVNIGRSQFHLPTGGPDVVRGHVGLVLPDREALLERLTQVKGDLDGTRFAVAERDGYVEATSPWGNRLRCFEPDARFGPITLGLPYVEFDVPPGTSPVIARFYREILGTRASVDEDGEGRFARCSVGNHQELVYRETDRPLPAYDGHHVQIYLADFSGPYERLKERGLVFEESDPWQYRFKDIVDEDGGRVVYTLEHEVRSMTHPLYARPLVNRDPSQSNRRFVAGHEEWRWVAASQP